MFSLEDIGTVSILDLVINDLYGLIIVKFVWPLAALAQLLARISTPTTICSL